MGDITRRSGFFFFFFRGRHAPRGYTHFALPDERGDRSAVTFPFFVLISLSALDSSKGLLFVFPPFAARHGFAWALRRDLLIYLPVGDLTEPTSRLPAYQEANVHTGTRSRGVRPPGLGPLSAGSRGLPQPVSAYCPAGPSAPRPASYPSGIIGGWNPRSVSDPYLEPEHLRAVPNRRGRPTGSTTSSLTLPSFSPAFTSSHP